MLVHVGYRGWVYAGTEDAHCTMCNAHAWLGWCRNWIQLCKTPLEADKTLLSCISLPLPGPEPLLLHVKLCLNNNWTIYNRTQSLTINILIPNPLYNVWLRQTEKPTYRSSLWSLENQKNICNQTTLSFTFWSSVKSSIT